MILKQHCVECSLLIGWELWATWQLISTRIARVAYGQYFFILCSFLNSLSLICCTSPRRRRLCVLLTSTTQSTGKHLQEQVGSTTVYLARQEYMMIKMMSSCTRARSSFTLQKTWQGKFHRVKLASIIPRLCAFVACSIKFMHAHTSFCVNFVLQATNAQALGTRLGWGRRLSVDRL